MMLWESWAMVGQCSASVKSLYEAAPSSAALVTLDNEEPQDIPFRVEITYRV
jgi:hypothetical protein